MIEGYSDALFLSHLVFPVWPCTARQISEIKIRHFNGRSGVNVCG